MTQLSRENEPCFLCNVQDPDGTQFDPEIHDVCMSCRVKLWEIAPHGLEFEMRGQVVSVKIGQQLHRSSAVVLTSGYEVALDDGNWMQNLFQAVLGESMTSADQAGLIEDLGWQAVHDACVLEIQYVAGQLRGTDYAVSVDELRRGFSEFWDDTSRRLNRGEYH